MNHSTHQVSQLTSRGRKACTRLVLTGKSLTYYSLRSLFFLAVAITFIMTVLELLAKFELKNFGASRNCDTTPMLPVDVVEEGRLGDQWIQVREGVVYKKKSVSAQQTFHSDRRANVSFTQDEFDPGPYTYVTEITTPRGKRKLKPLRITRALYSQPAPVRSHPHLRMVNSKQLNEVEKGKNQELNSAARVQELKLVQGATMTEFQTSEEKTLSNTREKRTKLPSKKQASSFERLKTKLNSSVNTKMWNPNVPVQILHECPFLRDELAANLTTLEFEQWVPKTFDAKKALSFVQLGGFYNPTDCYQKQVTAVLIPNFHRDDAADELVQFLHYFLQRQHKAYILVFATQANVGIMNRASMINIAVLEVTKHYPVDCFIIHDIDTFPLNWRNDYSCTPGSVRQLLTSRDTENFTPKYKHYMGGVTAISKQDFFRVNGMSNLYWSWGGEDDDMRIRVARAGLSFLRANDLIGRFQHKHRGMRIMNPLWQALRRKTSQRFSKDGLNSLKYEVTSHASLPYYTNITANILNNPNDAYFEI